MSTVYARAEVINIQHHDQEINDLVFKVIDSTHVMITGTDTMIETWILRENATVIEQETDSEFLSIIRSQKEDEFNVQLSSHLNTLFSKYTSEEINTFTIQETEALAYTADNNASTPFINSIASNRGIDRTLLIDKIINNSAAYRLAVSTEIGKKQKVFDRLQATTLTEINNVAWPM
jgi:hypothetical protein